MTGERTEDALSPKQRAILDFIRDYIGERDYPPAIRDIQQGCGISSTSVVDYNLKRLEERGYLRRDREISRAIELLDGTGRRRRALTVPVLGKIAAGQPIPTFPETLPEGYERIEVTREQTRGRERAFALRVEGSSMIEDLIQDGDVVILEPADTCDDGERVAVWLRDESAVTLKRLYREGERVRLQPANAAMDPIYADAENVEVQGRVLSTISMGG